MLLFRNQTFDFLENYLIEKYKKRVRSGIYRCFVQFFSKKQLNIIAFKHDKIGVSSSKLKN